MIFMRQTGTRSTFIALQLHYNLRKQNFKAETKLLMMVKSNTDLDKHGGSDSTTSTTSGDAWLTPKRALVWGCQTSRGVSLSPAAAAADKAECSRLLIEKRRT